MTHSVGKGNIVFFLILPIVFLFSHTLLDYYTGGDQVFYRAFYEEAAALSFVEALIAAKGILGSAEPLSIFVLWFGAVLNIDKDVYISFLNVILFFLVFRCCIKFKVHALIIFLVFINFYLLVLFTGAERLKIGFIFLFMSAIFEGRLRYFIFCLSCLAHFQLILLVPSLFLYLYSGELYRLFYRAILNRSLLYSLLLTSIAGVTFLIYLGDNILAKVQAYFSLNRGLGEILNLLLLILVGVLSSINCKRFLISMAPFLIAVLLFGGNRVNMLAVIFAVGVLIVEKRMFRVLPMLLLSYFAMKSFVFVYNIIVFGDGFV